ncbi:hypothetical protein RUND412_005839 [Rhizina undulata]
MQTIDPQKLVYQQIPMLYPTFNHSSPPQGTLETYLDKIFTYVKDINQQYGSQDPAIQVIKLDLRHRETITTEATNQIENKRRHNAEIISAILFVEKDLYISSGYKPQNNIPLEEVRTILKIEGQHIEEKNLWDLKELRKVKEELEEQVEVIQTWNTIIEAAKSYLERLDSFEEIRDAAEIEIGELILSAFDAIAEKERSKARFLNDWKAYREYVIAWIKYTPVSPIQVTTIES